MFRGSAKEDSLIDKKKKDFDMQYRASLDDVLRALFDYIFLKDKQDSSVIKSNNDFFEYQALLASIFYSKSYPATDKFPEMNKRDFCKVLEDAKILRLPKQEEKKADAKAKGGKDSKKNVKLEETAAEETKDKPPEILFQNEDVMEIIKPIQCFDDMLDYYNFLEALWRVAWNYPFTKEELQVYSTIDKKFRWMMEHLNAHFREGIKDYDQYLKEKEQRTTYQPRMVVPDEEEDMTDDDDD